MNNNYHAYPAKRPPKDDIYLVSVTNDFALQAGIAGHAVLIAKYSTVSKEWFALMGVNPVSRFDISQNILAWRELPRP